MIVTLFRDLFAQTAERVTVDLDELADLIRAARGSAKADLPLLKLATFGGVRSEKGSLRHDPNVLRVHGVECDYDGELVSFDAALQAVVAAGVEAILYTSPSHAPATPRWRVLFPLATPVDPPDRAALADRANGVLGGALARESWSLSQAYYYGATGPDFQLEVVRGTPIDALPGLEAVPYVPPPSPRRARSAAAPTPEPGAFDDLPQRLRKRIKSGDPAVFGLGTDRSRLVYSVVCGLVRQGWADEQIVALITNPAYPISAHVLEQTRGGVQRYAQRQCESARADVAADWERLPSGALSPQSQRNAIRALDELGVRLHHDVFRDRTYLETTGAPVELTDSHVVDLRFAIDDRFRFLPPKDLFYDVVDHVAKANAVNPALEYLDGLVWDGTPRLDTWIIDHCAPDFSLHEDNPRYSDYLRAIARLMLVAAVRRLRRPGCKFDTMLVFVNPDQGTNKSSAVQALAVNREWYHAGLPLHASDREIIEKLSGHWIIEYSELAGMRKRTVEEIKAFIEQQVDVARMAYGRIPKHAPRMCVFFGTTNSDQFLNDPQNRRFWPVDVKRIDVAALRAVVPQLWAEAVAAEADPNQPLELAEELWPVAASAQSAHRTPDLWVHLIEAALLAGGSVAEAYPGRVPGEELIKLMPNNQHRGDHEALRRIGEAMRELGWERRKARWGGMVRWVYYGPGDYRYADARDLVVVRDQFTGVASIIFPEPADPDPAPEPLDPRSRGRRTGTDDLPF